MDKEKIQAGEMKIEFDKSEERITVKCDPSGLSVGVEKFVCPLYGRHYGKGENGKPVLSLRDKWDLFFLRIVKKFRGGR